MELNVKTRTILGKKVKSLRKEGLVPAELFGHNVKNQHLIVSEKEFAKVYKTAGGHSIVYLVDEQGGKIPALIVEVQKHPLSFKPLSVDFHQVRMDESIEAKVPVEFLGTAPAEKVGFVVLKVLQEIEVKSLPNKIPPSFRVDLGKLEKTGDSIHVGDLEIPKDIKVMVPPETVIVSVTQKIKEEEVAPPAAEAPAAEPTIETKAAAPAEEKTAAEEKKQ